MERRQVLKLLGATAAIGTVSASQLAQQKQHSAKAPPPDSTPTATPGSDDDDVGVEFNRVVDAVDDLGMDPTGNQPIDEELAGAISDGTLIEFPPGTYQFETRHLVEQIERWGIRGLGQSRGAVRISPPRGEGHEFLNIRSGRDILIENITFDMYSSRPEWVMNVFKLDGGLRFRNVEYAGYHPSAVDAYKPNYYSGNHCLRVHVLDPQGVSIIDKFVKIGPTHLAEYPKGHSGIFVGPEETVGTVDIINSYIANMSSHAIYASKTRGTIRIENCVFENNNGTQARLSGADSYLKNSRIVIDTDNAHPNNIGEYNSISAGIWLVSAWRANPGGLIEDCTVVCKSIPRNKKINTITLLELDGSVGETVVRDTVIRAMVDDLRLVDANRPGKRGARVRTRGNMPVNPRVVLQNVDIIGQSSGQAGAIDIVGRDESIIENCRVELEGERPGIVVRNAAACHLRGSQIDLEGDGDGVILLESTGTIDDIAVAVPRIPLRIDALSEDAAHTTRSARECLLRVATPPTLQTSRQFSSGAESHFRRIPLESGCLPWRLGGDPLGKLNIVHITKSAIYALPAWIT